MSYIFDALQKSEAERSGANREAVPAATELLEIAERQAIAEREQKPQPVSRIASVTAKGEELPVLDKLTQSAITGLNAKDGAQDVAVPEQFNQFQSLKVSIPPDSRLVCITQKDSLAAEKFRFVAVRIRQASQARKLRKIVITSSVPQEGKSMVASNLACTLARRARQKTLLLEGDLRRPTLSQAFGLGKLPGICEWLQGESEAANSIYRLDGPDLWFLPAGSTPKNPLELMQSGRLSSIMDQLEAWFDWVIIDSPPVLPLADTSIWMRSADGILMVTRQGTTQKRQLQRALEVVEQSKLIGALLNSSSNAVHEDYYSHYHPSAISKNQVDHKK